MVEGAALEMLCGETHPGFESLTLRHKNPVRYDGILFLIKKKGSEFMDTGDSSTNAGGRSTCFYYDEFIFLNSPQGI